MAYASIAGLADLQNKLQTTLIDTEESAEIGSSLITQMLSNPNSESDWNKMDQVITKFTETYTPVLTGLRVLVTLTDGTVSYDSSKGKNNTFEKFQKNEINENHNTRVAIMLANLSKDGVGNETKYSTSTGVNQAYNAVRMGLATTDALGVRVSSDVDQTSELARSKRKRLL